MSKARELSDFILDRIRDDDTDQVQGKMYEAAALLRGDYRPTYDQAFQMIRGFGYTTHNQTREIVDALAVLGAVQHERQGLDDVGRIAVNPETHPNNRLIFIQLAALAEIELGVDDIATALSKVVDLKCKLIGAKHD
jgi:hypothetical protein